MATQLEVRVCLLMCMSVLKHFVFIDNNACLLQAMHVCCCCSHWLLLCVCRCCCCCCRADMSAQGLANSCGLMVNYLYSMPDVVSNNQRYLLEHHINASQAVQQLLLL